MSDKNDVRIDVVGDVGGFRGATAEAARELDKLKGAAQQAGTGMGSLEQAASKAGQAAGDLAKNALGDLAGSMGVASEESLLMAATLVDSAGALSALGVGLGAVAAGLGVVAAAYVIGQREAKAFTDTLILTGNAVGKTTSELYAMSAGISKATSATRGDVADALKDAVNFGHIGSQSLQTVVDSAIRMERETGTAVDKTVKQFSELGKEPVKASLKLDEQYNYLTASVFRQIKALEDQGRTTEAAKVAQDAFADALNSRTGEMEANLGTIARGWREVKKEVVSAASTIWNAFADIGRKKGPAEEIVELQNKMRTASPEFIKTNDIEGQIARLQPLADKEKELGAAREAQAEKDKQGIKASQMVDQYSDTSKRALVQAKIDLVKASAEIGTKRDEALKALQEEYDKIGQKKEPRARGGGGSAKVDDYTKTMQTLQEKIAVDQLELASTEKMSAAEKEHAKWLADVNSNRKTLTASQFQAAEAEWQEYLALDRKNAAYQAYRSALEKQEGENVKANQSMLEQIANTEKAAALYGLNAAQINAVWVARLEDARAMAEVNGAYPEQLAYLDDEIERRGRLSEALEKESLARLLANTESAKAAKAAADMSVLDRALAGGKITEQQYKEAVSGIKKVGDEMDEFAKQAARNMQDAMANFFIDPTNKGIQSIGKTFAETVQKMIAQAGSAQLMKLLFGDMGKTGEVGGFAGSLFSGAAKMFGGGGGGSAVGGIDWASYTVPAWHAGGVVEPGGQTFSRLVPASAFTDAPRFHQGGFAGNEVPAILQRGERVLTADQQKGMGGMTINQTINAGPGTDKHEIKRAAASGARSVLAVANGARRYG